MKTYKKRNFPLDEIRRFVEPGPIVLVSSAWKGETNIMTMGWHTMMSFTPALIGCDLWPENHSFDMVRKSKECRASPSAMRTSKARWRTPDS